MRREVRRQVWQVFLGWFTPGDRDDSAPSRELALVVTPNEPIDPRMYFDEGPERAPEGEILEFLAADEDPIPADPEFRERLRERLWSLVQDGVTSHSKDH
jgi:hypothetical protein